VPSQLVRVATEVAYAARQLPRMAWYLGHSLLLRELSQSVREREAPDTPRRVQTGNARVPDRARIYADMAKVFLQDLANVVAGIYPIPADHDGSFSALVHRSRIFLDDLPSIHQRRKRRAHDEVLNETTRGKRPRYYLQNFHYQSGGWLTAKSAELYDTQVEILFNGSANAIRRQALPQLHEIFAGQDQRKLQVIDIGCGTGRFIDALKQVWPKLPVLGIDMSEAYVRHARRHLQRWSRVNFSVAKAESLPVPDDSQDALVSIFLFHELPPKVRRIVFRECARVLKPGGRFVLVDSLQHGDQPDYDGLLDVFPKSYHEPYYRSYLDEDFGAVAKSCGLVHVRDVDAFISKVMVFDKMSDETVRQMRPDHSRAAASSPRPDGDSRYRQPTALASQGQLLDIFMPNGKKMGDCGGQVKSARHCTALHPKMLLKLPRHHAELPPNGVF
jgi:ubiquinone/menaquinone biosynthesis C-methylase UbiE